GELEIMPLGVRNVRRRGKELVRPATLRASAARDQLRIRSVGGVDRLDADVRPQRRDVVRLAIGRPLAGVSKAAGDVDVRLLDRVLAVRRDIVDGESG